MKDLLAIKKLSRVYGIIVALFLVLAVYTPTKSLPVMDHEVAQLSEEENDRMERAAVAESTVTGDVYDRNGTLICKTDEETGKMTYRETEIYSNLLGKAENEDGLLMDNLMSVLKSPDGNTNKGDSLVLTVDTELQQTVYQLLANGPGERSSAVVLDAKTGAILSMANYPSYDITQEITVSGKNCTPLKYPWRPGSIFKVITGIGINENGWENEIVTDKGSLEIETGGVIYNDGVSKSNAASKAQNPKKRDFYSALEYSSNVYFGSMAYRLGWAKMEELASRFYIGQQELPFEFGQMNSTFESAADPYDKSKANETLAKLGYGYAGLQLTALQAAMVTQAIANGGELCMPYLLDQVITNVGVSVGEGQYAYEKGEAIDVKVANWKKGETETVMDSQVAANIRSAMVKGYTHTKYAYELSHAAVSGLNDTGIEVNGVTYSLAMKTGTADVNDNGDNNAWIISMAPVEDPQYIVVVTRYMVPEKTYGNSVLEDVAAIYRQLFSQDQE